MDTLPSATHTRIGVEICCELTVRKGRETPHFAGVVPEHHRINDVTSMTHSGDNDQLAVFKDTAAQRSSRLRADVEVDAAGNRASALSGVHRRRPRRDSSGAARRACAAASQEASLLASAGFFDAKEGAPAAAAAAPFDRDL